MRSIRTLLLLLACSALGASASCGSGLSDGGGVTGSGLVIGPITGFGSIIVNDIEFDAMSASVTVDGVSATESDLRLGMIVEVRGTVDSVTGTGVATSVLFDDELQGPVEQVDVSASTIIVLGQVVLVDAATVFDGTSLPTLAPGDVIEVSGFRDGDGNVHATRIELKMNEDELEIRGAVTDLDSGSQTFRIGGQLVDYSAAEIENEPAGGLADGLFVEVEAALPFTGGVLVADRIEVENEEFEGEEGDEVEIKGLVSSVISSEEFILNGLRRVLMTPSTIIEGGSAGDIVVDVRLVAKGELDAMGVLIADKIEIEN